ncbi:MAG: penicillin acylase family protein [Sphingomonas sp.]
MRSRPRSPSSARASSRSTRRSGRSRSRRAAGARIAIHGGPSAAGVLNAIHSAPAPEGLVPFHGTSYLQVVHWDARGPIADSMLSYSQSSDPESPWHADGTRDYSAKRWLRLPYAPAEIAAARVGDPVTISE